MAYRRSEQRKAARERSAGSAPRGRGASKPTPEGGRRQAWTRVARSRADAVAGRLSASVAGSLAAAWGAILTLLVVGAIVITAWVLGAGSGSITDAIHASGIFWLASHQIPITMGEATISVIPFGLVVVPGWMLWRAGRWATRRSAACEWSEVRVSIAMAAGVYGTLGLLVSSVVSDETSSVSSIWALIGTGIFAALVYGAAAVHEAKLWPTLIDRFPAEFRLRFRSALVAVCTVACAATALFAFSLAWHFADGLTIFDILAPGFIGNILLFVLGVAYLPNLIVWASSFTFGTGFALGVDTGISPFGADPASVPALPALAAAPESVPAWMPVVLLIPLFAGALAIRRYSPEPLYLRSRQNLIIRCSIAGLGAAVVLVACWFASGSLGVNAMSQLGPSPFKTALAAFGLFLIGGYAGDIYRMIRNWWKARRADREIDVRDKADQILDIHHL